METTRITSYKINNIFKDVYHQCFNPALMVLYYGMDKAVEPERLHMKSGELINLILLPFMILA